jgi:hypothetical protein
MIREMAGIAAECVRTPGRSSVWSGELNRYVCTDTPEGEQALAQLTGNVAVAHPPINPQFKLVFLTAVAGTVLFVGLCLVLSLIAGREPPPLFEKVIMGFFDLAKIGFGAVVGLLGGKKLHGLSESA